MTVRALYEVIAPAKLNLFLHVVGRRPDGYHLLQSAIVLIDWADTLHFERRTDAALRRHDLGAALPADDLCLRAARALQQASGTDLGVDLSIDKQVPAGAGMGGGSSDAATTLLALNRLWGLNWPRRQLMPLALALGADVPFFIGGNNALVEGIGERLTPLAIPEQWFAVVKPAAALSTAAIFASAKLVRDNPADILSGSLAGAIAGPAPFGRNDLQPPAEELCTDLVQVAGWLSARFGNSRMTGSGSAVFARAGTGDAPAATFSAQDLAPGWVGRMCRSLRAHPLRDWAEG
jgi:4-diphosphocytidyl-2-C-methyl-D-erythritol kinase